MIRELQRLYDEHWRYNNKWYEAERQQGNWNEGWRGDPVSYAQPPQAWDSRGQGHNKSWSAWQGSSWNFPDQSWQSWSASSSSRQNPNRITSWDHPKKETPQEYKRRRAQLDKAQAEADSRYQRKEQEREERRYMVDSVGSSPYQRQLLAERQAQQDNRRHASFPPHAPSDREDDYSTP